MADSPDVAVDVLRKRARRRLVGAILLALIAAVVLPIFLESDPKPLGQDVSIQIPPVDGGKFASTRPAPVATQPGAPVAEAPKAEAAKPDPAKAEVAKAEATKAEVVALPRVEPRPQRPDAPQPAEAGAPTSATAAPAAGAAVKPPEPAPQKAAGAASGTPAPGTFAVQVGALADHRKANEMASKLRAVGHPVYVSEVATASGVVYRVRVSGFASRDAALAALPRLRDQGFPGIVAEVK